MLNKKIFIPVANPTVGIEEANSVHKQIKSGWFSMGKKVKEFEKKVEKYIGVKHAIAINNGTSALDAVLTALNITEKDEVIVPSLTYISTANVVSYKKAKLVLCDSEEDTFNVSYESLISKITKKTKLIIVTDLKGMPVDYDKYIKLSKKMKIPIIADSAESFGAEYKHRKVGSQLLAHTFSFFANKNITTGGEGGMISTSNLDIWSSICSYKDHGKNFKKLSDNKDFKSFRWIHDSLGTNMRLTEMQSAIGRVQLKFLDSWQQKRSQNALFLANYLKDISSIRIPLPDKNIKHAWYKFYCKLNFSKLY